MRTQGIPPDFRGGVHSFICTAIRRRVNREFLGSRQLRTDGVHCRESAGTGPVVLKVVQVTGAAFADHRGPIIVRLFFLHPLLAWHEAGMLKFLSEAAVFNAPYSTEALAVDIYIPSDFRESRSLIITY